MFTRPFSSKTYIKGMDGCFPTSIVDNQPPARFGTSRLGSDRQVHLEKSHLVTTRLAVYQSWDQVTRSRPGRKIQYPLRFDLKTVELRGHWVFKVGVSRYPKTNLKRIIKHMRQTRFLYPAWPKIVRFLVITRYEYYQRLREFSKTT